MQGKTITVDVSRAKSNKHVVSLCAKSLGNGIYLLDKFEDLKSLTDRQLIQEYIGDPFLMSDQLKFDFRIYAVVKSLNPLSIYVAREGMVRFCTEKYKKPVSNKELNLFAHLTNYSLNKSSNAYKHSTSLKDQIKGSKRLLSTVFHQMDKRGMNTRKLWHKIKIIIVKTVIAMLPEIMLNYEQAFHDIPGPNCFQIMGFDVMVQGDGTPILLEVNSAPSLTIEHSISDDAVPVRSIVDEVIKVPLVRDCLLLAMNQLENEYHSRTDIGTANSIESSKTSTSNTLSGVFKNKSASHSDDIILELKARERKPHLSCQDLETNVSTCQMKCQTQLSPEACLQGCRAVSDLFLNSLQQLIDKASVDTNVDVNQGILTKFVFEESWTSLLQDISVIPISFYAQHKSSALDSGWKWTELPLSSFKSPNWITSTEITIPFEQTTSIQLRLSLTWRNTTITSRTFTRHLPDQPLIGTLAPQLSSTLQIDYSSFVACWEISRVVDKEYAVTLTDLDDKLISEDKVTGTCYIFKNLPRSNCCKAKVTLISNETIHFKELEFHINLMTLLEEDEMNLDEDTEKLIFSNGTYLFYVNDLNDYIMLNEPIRLNFKADGDALISSLVNLDDKKILIGMSDGSIFEYEIEQKPKAVFKRDIDESLNTTTTEMMSSSTFSTDSTISPPVTFKRLRDSDGSIISYLAIDPVQKFFYAILNSNTIIRCHLSEGCSKSTTTLTATLPYQINQIEIDYFNGFIYLVNNNKEIFQMSLFPFESKEVYQLNGIKKIELNKKKVQAISLSMINQTLLAITDPGIFIESNLINNNLTNLRQNLKLNDVYKEVTKFDLSKDRLFWISSNCGASHPWSSCLLSEEKDATGENVHLNKYLYAGKIVSFAFMKEYHLPKVLPSPNKVGLSMSDIEGKVTWTGIKSLNYQNQDNSWRNIEYKVSLTPNDNMMMNHNVKSLPFNETYITLPVKSSTQYIASVKVCLTSTDICSTNIKTVDTTFDNIEFGNNKNNILIYSYKKNSNENLTINDLLGNELSPSAVGDYYPKIPLNDDMVLAFENSTKIIYYAKDNSISFTRSHFEEPSFRFMDFITVNHILLLPKRALIVLGSSYTISAYRLTSTFAHSIYSCTSRECGEVAGIGGDEDTGDIFYLTHNINGTSSLYKFSSETKESNFIAESKKFPPIKQLLIFQSKIIFVTKFGHVGSCDQTLDNVNINWSLKDVLFLVPLQILKETDNNELFALPDNTIKFESDIEFGTNERTELSWKMNPSIPYNGVVYKIQLFRDSFVGDRTVEISLNSTLKIPQHVLDKWGSRQKFDVMIDAITPWTWATINKTGILAPTKAPSAPRKLQIFATQQTTVDGPRAVVDLFWEEPEEMNGELLFYQVNCSNTEMGWAKVELINVRKPRTFSLVAKSGKIDCVVGASNEVGIFGRSSDTISIDSSELKPLVKLYAIDSIGTLMALTNWSSSVSGPLRNKKNGPSYQTIPSYQVASSPLRRKRQVEPAYQLMSFIGQDLYAVRREPDNQQLSIVLLDQNEINLIIHKVVVNGDFSTIDAITSDWIANRLLIVANHQVMQISLELFTSLSVVTPRKLFSLSSASQEAKQLLFDPFSNTGYLLTKNGSLFSLDIKEGTEQNLALSIDCLRSQTVTSAMTEFLWNRPTSPLIYALTWNGLITIDPKSKDCNDIDIDWSKFTEKGLKSISSFSIADKLFVFVTSSQLSIYDRNSVSATPIAIQNPPLKQILVVSQSAQPSPERSCFALPASNNIKFNVKNEDRSGALIEITEPNSPTNCIGLSLPPTQYEVHFKRKNTDKVKHIQSISNVIHVENGILDRETDYEVSVTWLNRYSPPSSQSESKLLKTGYGYPSAPQNLAAFSVSPDTIIINWLLPQMLNAPIEEIKYKITQQSSSLTTPSGIGGKNFANGVFSPSSTDVIVCNGDPCQTKVSNLRPSTDYKFWVTAVHESRLKSQFISDDGEAVSTEAVVRTKDIAGTLRPDNVTSDEIILRWSSLEPESLPATISIDYRQSGVDTSYVSPMNASFKPSDLIDTKTMAIEIGNLKSAITYDYRFVATYKGEYEYQGKNKSYEETFVQTPQQIRTKPGTPSAPQFVTTSKDIEGWIVRWENPVSDSGSAISSYAVEYRSNASGDWEIAERGLPSDKLWWRPVNVNDHNSPLKSEYRVRAANSEGFGGYAFSKLDETLIVKESNNDTLTFFLILVALIIMVLLLVAAIMVYLAHMKKLRVAKRKKKIHRKISMDMLEGIGRYVDANCQLPNDIQIELDNLPKVEERDVERGERIGNGSFGIVFKGTAANITSKTINVAIKTLKERYTAEDRIKFLKEAILMNNFDHRNIVKLLGVCFEGEHNFLVIELMEEGDLLKFLRTSRPGHFPSKISIKDMLGMMVDVGRGAAYLEMNKHVHRDIAARNCLISSANVPSRVTKIADFGLARDVYVSDYYKVNESDMLPVRWLAPECINDGRFSNKSDVYSYGVLLWEILSLGQTPYGHLRNCEVMAKVTGGEKLVKPKYSPDEIYEVIKVCLTFDVNERPNFANILPMIEDLRMKKEYANDDNFPSQNDWNEFVNFNNFEASIRSVQTTDSSSSRQDDRKYGNPNSKFKNDLSDKRSVSSLNYKNKRREKKDCSAMNEYPNSFSNAGFNNSCMRDPSVISANTTLSYLESDYELPSSSKEYPQYPMSNASRYNGFTRYDKNYMYSTNLLENSTSYDAFNEDRVTKVVTCSGSYFRPDFEESISNWNGPMILGVYISDKKIVGKEAACVFCTLKRMKTPMEMLEVFFIYKWKNPQYSNQQLIDTMNSFNCTDLFTFKKFCSIRKLSNKQKRISASKFPINILRNIMKSEVKTNFMILTDLNHLYSENFETKISALAKNVIKAGSKNVLAIRMFEISGKIKNAVRNKKDLKKYMQMKQAYEFHASSYPRGHKIPKLSKWFDKKDTGDASIQFVHPYKVLEWEPQIVTSKNVPDYYDMPYPLHSNTSHRRELCRANYKFLVVNDVFAYHHGFKSNSELNFIRSVARKHLNNKLFFRVSLRFERKLDKLYPKTHNQCPRWTKTS
uniref:Receptor protein-tyrosine kinase n=1 Tax=Rhabditophanes sp. KR3021 TaxID=114890 RepID=A0AC35U7T4_9BILA